MKALDELPNNDTFQKTSKQTIEFKANSPSHFGQLGNQLTIDYSYIAGNELGRYKTQFIPHKNFAGDSSVFDKEKLNLTIVVESKEESRPPAEEDKRPTPPDQDEQVIPPKSNRSTGFSLLTKALGVLAFLGGTVWFIIKHIFRL